MLGKGQRLQSRGMKVENETKINHVVLGKYSILQKSVHSSSGVNGSDLQGKYASLRLLGRRVIRVCVSNLFKQLDVYQLLRHNEMGHFLSSFGKHCKNRHLTI